MNSVIVRFCPKHLPSCRPLSLLEQAGGGGEELLLRGVFRGMPESESVPPGVVRAKTSSLISRGIRK